MMSVKIVQAGPDEAPLVIELVDRLLQELGEEGDEAELWMFPIWQRLGAQMKSTTVPFWPTRKTEPQ
jgi:hypothetical protein